MKRNLLATAFCLLSFCAFSQINLGIKGGLNLGDLKGDDVEDTKLRPSFLAGAYLGINLTEKFRIQPEVLYVSAGSKSEGYEPAFGQNYDETLKLDYISVPVMFVYNITKAFNVQAGPQVGILASGKEAVKLENGTKIEVDAKDELKKSDFALNAGVGLDLGKFNISARYSFGLTNVIDSDITDVSAKNRSIQIAVGYTLFNFGK